MLTPEYLHKFFRYDQELGVLFWKVTKALRTRVGDAVLSKDSKGYVQVGLDGNKYRAHRIIGLCITATSHLK